MSYPYYTKKTVNTGTAENPIFQDSLATITVKSNNHGPYMTCKECRAEKDETLKQWYTDNNEAITKYLQKILNDEAEETDEDPDMLKEPEITSNFAIAGAARCVSHILNYHDLNGSLTDELRADVLRRDAINNYLRKGQYA